METVILAALIVFFAGAALVVRAVIAAYHKGWMNGFRRMEAICNEYHSTRGKY
jgi:hypothetical protein